MHSTRIKQVLVQESYELVWATLVDIKAVDSCLAVPDGAEFDFAKPYAE